MGVRDLAQRGPALWQAATRHPFLDRVRDGTLAAAAFDRWLEQDRLFVEELARAWAVVLASAPVEDLGLLSDGIAAFVGEVAWLEEVGAARRRAVPAAPVAVTAAYNAHLRAVASEPYPVALAALWVVEAAYLDAWRSARPAAARYREFVEHWSDDTFAAFVGRVEAAADRALVAASEAEVGAAAVAVATTARHEARFWAMSLGT